MQERKRTNKKYSVEYKLTVIMDMLDNNLGYKETMRKYFKDLEPKNYKFIKIWEDIYLQEGAEGLMKERRGRVTKLETPKKDKPTMAADEDLIAENRRLRMENEYLKKLQALILAEKQEKNKKQ